MIKATGEFGIRKIPDLANWIFKSRYVSEAMRESVFIAIPKKLGALECCIHRTVRIISQLGKVLLRVTITKLRGKSTKELMRNSLNLGKEKAQLRQYLLSE